MRKILFISLLFTLAFSSCLKDEEGNTYEAQVTINGTKTTISDLIFYIYENGQSKYYYISTSNDDDNSIEINFLNPTTGTLTFSEDNTIEITIGSNSYYSTTGSFTITEASESVVSGSFTGTFRHNNTNIQVSGNFSAEQRRGEI